MLEWRVLPEFPKYEITEEGDVRNRLTKKKLNEIENKRSGAFSYCLWIDDKRSTHRHYEGLIYSAFPDLEPEPEWKPIPEFPQYAMNKKGLVKNIKSAKRLTFRNGGISGEPMVRLRKNDITHHVLIDDVLNELFPDTREMAFA
jgi:hypothetical protein